jgi:hypothetical protein
VANVGCKTLRVWKARKVLAISCHEVRICALQVNHILPPSMPALPHLRTPFLHRAAKLNNLPASVAASLKSLTELNLHGYSFTQLPAAVSHISTLQIPDLSVNHSLQLKCRGIKILAALPSLQSVSPKGRGRKREWSGESAAAIHW